MPKKKPNPKEKSVSDVKLHDLIIQDRIAGLTVGEIARRHNMHRPRVSEICQANLERIQKERSALLEDRQEKINQALEKDVQELVELVTQSTTILKQSLATLVEMAGTEEFLEKPSHVLRLVEVSAKTFEIIRSALLAQQKEANK